MFTRLKVKDSSWENVQASSAICCLPLVGLMCGFVTYTVLIFGRMLAIKTNQLAFLATVSMFALSGFLHLDGFMDSADALLSSRDQEGKLRILKDSNVGAFSVIALSALALCLITSMQSWIESSFDDRMAILVPAASRAICAGGVFKFDSIAGSSMMAFFKNSQKPVHFIICVVEFVVIGGVFAFLSINGAIALAIATIFAIAVFCGANKALGGINGDILGMQIVVFEAAMYFLLTIAL